MRVVSLKLFTLWVALAAVTGAKAGSLRIAGGSVTTINNYPSMAVVLGSPDFVVYRHICGGTILNNRSILTAAHCFTSRSFGFESRLGSPDFVVYRHICGGTILNNRSILTAAHCFTVGDDLRRNRFRVGSSWATSGGVVHTASRIIMHPQYTPLIWNDIAILQTGNAISYNDVVRPGSFAGPNSNIPDDTAVWAAGWGKTGPNDGNSEQLKHAQLWTMSQAACRQRWGNVIDDDMICVQAREENTGQCSGDSGGPLYFNNVVIGVLSFGGNVCGVREDPTVSMRVSRYIHWIQANA
ncbi:trypsin CFT-1-like [Anticarsia gemmatalis]|uniref:trypsin CFT-1-like n=1 Tax=Anticarsia gemmatalis TaxID=129554 RepID=UPI003F770525